MERYEEVVGICQRPGMQRLKPIQALPEEVSYEDIKLVVASLCRQSAARAR